MACSLIAQSIGYVQMPNRSLVAWGLAALTFAGGAFLLVGLMTPFMGVLAAAGGVAAGGCGVGGSMTASEVPNV